MSSKDRPRAAPAGTLPIALGIISVPGNIGLRTISGRSHQPTSPNMTTSTDSSCSSKRWRRRRQSLTLSDHAYDHHHHQVAYADDNVDCQEEEQSGQRLKGLLPLPRKRDKYRHAVAELISPIQSFLNRTLCPPPAFVALYELLQSISGFLSAVFSPHRMGPSVATSIAVIEVDSHNGLVYPEDIPGFRPSSSSTSSSSSSSSSFNDDNDTGEDGSMTSEPLTPEWPKQYQPLAGREFWQYFKYLAMPQVKQLEYGKAAHSLNFQPSPTTRTQDRYVVKELKIRGKTWTFTGVFDGHLGDYTVDHVAHHLPIIVEEFLTAEYDRDPSKLWTADFIANLFCQSIVAFDNAIANDVLDLFGGSVEDLDRYSDAEIRRVINDEHRGGDNWRKARLCMYGCCAVVALVDPCHENLWVANLGDCQAFVVSPSRSGDSKAWDVELLTTEHSASNDAEIQRVQKEHPGEPFCVKNRRILGALAPFRCLGDIPFKQPPAFSRRIIYNIAPGFRDVSPWEAFLELNHTPPYISAQPEITHRRISSPKTGQGSYPSFRPTFLILASDGFADICSSHVDSQKEILATWAQDMVDVRRFEVDGGLVSSNMAMRLLWHAMGGTDASLDLSKVLTLEMDGAWIDDTAIIVQTLT